MENRVMMASRWVWSCAMNEAVRWLLWERYRRCCLILASAGMPPVLLAGISKKHKLRGCCVDRMPRPIRCILLGQAIRRAANDCGCSCAISCPAVNYSKLSARSQFKLRVSRPLVAPFR